MYSKALALVAASFVGQAIAAHHQNGHQHIHQYQKKALVTEHVTVTDWVTVTVVEGAETSTRARVFVTQSRKFRSRLSSSVSVSSASTSAAPTTLIPQVKPAVSAPESSTQSPTVSTPPAVAAISSTPPAVVEVVSTPPVVVEVASTPAAVVNAPAVKSSTSAAAPVVTTETTTETTGDSGKRGLAYNNAALLSRFTSSGTKVSWAYNWGQYDDSGTDLEFCPMMWGLKVDFAETWPKNAQAAIDAGSKHLLSFNEPDLDSQSNMTPQLAAQKHIELMNPFASSAKIGSPAITNSGAAGQGIDWMKQFFSACGGSCAVDFIAIHIYGVDTNVFLQHLRDVNAAFNKPVWITEFAFSGSDDEINSQLATVVDQIENNSTYSFVERYSYFFVDNMVKGDSLSTYGNTFAFSA